MKTDAVSGRIKYRVGKKVIQIYKHGSQHNKIRLFPVFTKKNQGNKHRKHQVQKVMGDLFYQYNFRKHRHLQIVFKLSP